jgi:hypothetical protein
MLKLYVRSGGKWNGDSGRIFTDTGRHLTVGTAAAKTRFSVIFTTTITTTTTIPVSRHGI